jgi:hypothetical protein
MRLKIDPHMTADSPIRLIDSGPYTFFLARLVNGASCHIQQMWEGVVFRFCAAIQSFASVRSSVPS